MNIGVFGGVFNPIHIGHLILAQSALEEFKLDKVIFVPGGNPPHKDTGIIECRHRFKMIELAISDNSKFAVSDIECKRVQPIHIKRFRKSRRYTLQALSILYWAVTLLRK